MKSIAFVSDDKEQLRKAEAAIIALGFTWQSGYRVSDNEEVVRAIVRFADGMFGAHSGSADPVSDYTTLRSFMLAVIEDMPDEPEPIIWDGDPVLFHDDHVTLGSKQWVNIDNETILAIADRIREGQG